MITPPTPEDVRKISGSTLPDETIQCFIDAAVCVAERIEPCMNGKGISEACKTQVVTFLAAHMLAQSGVGGNSGIKKRETFENWTVEYVVGNYQSSGVLSTPYGNTANAISDGCLQEVDKTNYEVFYGGGAI